MNPNILTIVISILFVSQISASASNSHENNETELISFPILIPPTENINFNQVCFAIKLTSEITVSITNNDTVSQEFVEFAKNPLTFTNCSASFTDDAVIPLTISEPLSDILDLDIIIPLVNKSIILVKFTFSSKTRNYGMKGGKILNPGSTADVEQILVPLTLMTNVTVPIGTGSYCRSYHLQTLGSSTTHNTEVDVSFDNLRFEVIKRTLGEIHNATNIPFSKTVQVVCKNETAISQPLLGGGAGNQFKSFSGPVLIIMLVLTYLNFNIRN